MKQSVYADVQAALREEAEERAENIAYLDSFYVDYPEAIFEDDLEPDDEPMDLAWDRRDYDTYDVEEEWPTWREDNFGKFGP